MVESRISELLKHHEEGIMSHRRKKYLSAGLAGVLCSTALLGIAMADDRDRGRETEREMEMGTETEAEKCLLP